MDPGDVLEVDAGIGCYLGLGGEAGTQVSSPDFWLAQLLENAGYIF